jgi:hypothetical protein
MRGRGVAGALALAALGFGLASARPARALAPNTLALDFGKTTTISGAITGGGVSLGLGALWRVEESPWALPLRFGVMTYWDDMGTQIVSLTNGSGTYLGRTSGLHQSVYGAAFRLDYEPAVLPVWHPYASGTWGYYRVENDVRGGDRGAVSAPGFSLGLGLGHRFYENHDLGLVVRYHRLFDDVTGRYLSAGVEWGWRGGGAR